MKNLITLFLLWVLSLSPSYSQSWEPLPGGSLNGVPSTMISFGGYRWFSGGFSTAGPINSMFVARHDGSNWVSTPALVGPATAFCVWNNTLYGSGSFEVGVLRYGAVKWNGAGWDYFGLIPSGSSFSTLTIFNNELVFGGRALSVEGVPISHLAKWNSTTWSAFPFTIICSWLTLADIRKVDSINSYLHIGGDFNYVNGIPAGLAFKTDGTSVIPMGLDWNYYVADFIKYHDSTFCTGNFPFGPFPTNEGSPGIVKTDDFIWHQVNHGLKMRGLSMTTSQTDLYVGGYYDNTCHNSPCNHDDVGNLGKWNGTSWSNESYGLFNQGTERIDFLYTDTLTGTMYALGDFTTVRGDVADFVAKRQFSIVPINLSSFNVKLVGDKVELSWQDQTPSDQNLFEVQVSNDGRNFYKIGTVKGNDYSNYYFFEYKPTSCGKLFFRLAFENKFSDIRPVTVPCPGPKITVNNRLLIVDTKVPGTLLITSTTGQILSRATLANDYYQIPVNIPAGIYVVTFIDIKGNRSNQKIIVQ